MLKIEHRCFHVFLSFLQELSRLFVLFDPNRLMIRFPMMLLLCLLLAEFTK